MLVAENTSLVSCKDHHTCPLQAVVPLTGRTSKSSCRLVAPVPSRLQRTCQCPQRGTRAWRLEWDVAALGPQVAPQFPRIHNTSQSRTVVATSMYRGGGEDVSARAHTLAASGRWVAYWHSVRLSEDERLGTRCSLVPVARRMSKLHAIPRRKPLFGTYIIVCFRREDCDFSVSVARICAPSFSDLASPRSRHAMETLHDRVLQTCNGRGGM